MFSFENSFLAPFLKKIPSTHSIFSCFYCFHPIKQNAEQLENANTTDKACVFAGKMSLQDSTQRHFVCLFFFCQLFNDIFCGSVLGL